MDSDERIVEGILLKKEDALEAFIEKYAGLIKAIVNYHLKGFWQYREECMQDILISIWNNIKSYNPEKNSLKNWVGAVSKYKCIDYKRKYYKELFFDELDENIKAPAVISEIEEETESILSCLSEPDRELFYRHYILGEKIELIAESKNKTSDFFYNRLSRGRNKIRNYLQNRSDIHEK